LPQRLQKPGFLRRTARNCQEAIEIILAEVLKSSVYDLREMMLRYFLDFGGPGPSVATGATLHHRRRTP
jgi:hypothetical protein